MPRKDRSSITSCEKSRKKLRKSTEEAAAVPAGPATEQAGPAQVEKAAEVVAKASTQPLTPKSLNVECQPFQIDGR